MTSDDRMADSQQRAFLTLALSFNPYDEPGRILNQCRKFTQCGPDEVLIEVVGDSTDDPYASAQYQLKNLRARFWVNSVVQRSQQIQLLESSTFPDIRAQAKRLGLVASRFDKLRSLERQVFMNEKFFREFCKVLVSSPSEANRVREAQLRWMRPVNNEGYIAATEAIQTSANLIRIHAPEVFQLERAWLNELLEFEPQSELVDESANSVIGWMFIVMAFALIVAMVNTVIAIFET